METQRIAVFCARDWLHPKAGAAERYVHEVFSRIARWGHYVLLVSHTHRILQMWNREASEMQLIDGIQIARLGPRPFFRMMSGMLLDRINANRNTITAFDAVVDCVTHRPMRLSDHTHTPVIPLTFDISPAVRASSDPPGPVIAATERARRKLLRAGFAEGFIVRAPFGVGTTLDCVSTSRAPEPTLALCGGMPPILRAALRMLKKDGLQICVSPVGPQLAGHGHFQMARRGAEEPIPYAQACQRAWFGFCAAGMEQEALEMGAHGLPVLCAETEASAEYVEDGATGIICPASHARQLAEHLRGLVADESLRLQLGARGRERAQEQSWERTAGLVLATIENISKPAPSASVASGACLARK